MGCCAGCMRWTLILLNAITAILGLIAVGFGIYVLVDKSEILELLGNTSEMPAFLDKTAIILIVGGSVVTVIATIGLFGAWKRHKRLLCVYGVALIVAMVLQVVAVILACVYRNEIEAKFKTGLMASLRESYVMPKAPGEGVNVFSSVWDATQYQLECCGVENLTDYRDAERWIREDNLTVSDTEWPVPLSCCKYSNPWVYPDEASQLLPVKDLCYPRWNKENTWTNSGCHEKLKIQLLRSSMMIIIAAAVTAITQVLLMLFAWALYFGWCGTKKVLV